MTSALPVEEHNYRTASAGLDSACERGDEEEVQFLLHAGVDVDTRFEFGMTPLMKASARGHAGVVAILLTPGKREGGMKLKTKVREPAQVDLKNSDQGTTALHLAAYNGHPAVVALLLSAGATVDATAKDGETPLMHACFNGHIGCVEPLLAAGADFDLVTPQHGTSPLLIAASRLHRTVVLRLLSAGANVNTMSRFEDTPLIRATYRGNLDMVDILLDAGADPDARNTRGKNALDIARDRGFKHVEDRLFSLTEPRSRVQVSVHPPPRPYNIM